MKKLYILPIVAAALALTGCSKENPFEGSQTGAEGKFMKSALSVELNSDEFSHQNIRTRAAEVDDFTILFIKDGQQVPAAKYKYAEMPDVVTLPEGSYSVKASYGEDRNAEWENPYFLGESEAFEIKAYEITSYIEPIVCSLENVKVTIDFDPLLRQAMSADSYVEVKLGDNDGLKYTSIEADSQKGGYFRIAAESTLVATFYGTVDGAKTVESKSYNNISKGNHYKVTFRLHPDPNDPSSDVNGEVMVDASVVITNMETNVEVGEDPLLDDNERPREDNGDNPGEKTAPGITAEAPLNIDIVNDGNSMTTCVLNIHSYAPAGIQEFTCVIDSPTLTPEELESVGLAANLNLAETPANLQGALSGLGFPTNVKGQKDVQFVITNFLPMLAALGESEHHFILTVTDEYGTTQKTLKIKY